ncbi:Transcription factor Pig1p [Madurella fahalii]|uniref:Transcription factor Pig1p n=1 Tax=Madurella fahalii TaxID=1157608 RepID=A0ABQ0FYA0_9PEZI
MASPIGHLIHPPDPPPPPPPPAPPQKPPFDGSADIATPIHPAVGTRIPFVDPPSLPSNRRASVAPHLNQPDSEGPVSQQPTESHSKTQSLYQCADCLRRYSRPEHLQRHIATHTLGKRFICDICSKAFSRADLLKRHRTNHLDNDGAKRRRINFSPSANRVAQACQPCAKARVKCEELKPCARCTKRGLACEVASSEDAAVQRLHLSARHVGSTQDEAPDSAYSLPSVKGYTQSQFAAAVPSPAFAQLISPEGIDEGLESPNNSSIKDEVQLPTPETSLDHSNLGSFQPYPRNHVDHAARESTKPPFCDFLRDVLYDQSLGNHARLAEAQGLDVLNFYDDTNPDFKEFDFGLLDPWSFDATGSVGNQAVSSEDNLSMTAMRSALVKIWTESPWRWSPEKTDCCYAEQANLPLPSKDAHSTQIQGNRAMADRVSKDTLHSSCRDKILAIVLSTCRDKHMADRVTSSFPSASAMDSWIHIFLAAHLCQVSSWIHYGSLSLNSQSSEWLAIAAAAGAFLTPVPALRRFGLALQETVRIAIPSKFEENNKRIAELGNVQALVLVQDVGLWSGNRRKMEIAECHLSVPIAMMRYRGKFGRSFYPDVVVYPSDAGKVLEDKWKQWHELESWKRLVFHAYLRDAQISMTQFNNPSMSYAELTLPLPCSKELWFARSAEEFKMRCLEAGSGDGKRLPSLGDLFRDINSLSTNHQRLDVQFSVSIYLHGFWSLIWEYRQLNTVHRPATQPPAFASNAMGLLLDSRHQELCKQLEAFQYATRGWHEHGMLLSSSQESMVLHLLLMNLHVSLNDLQLFSGKEGEDQARRVYPALQCWAASIEGRQALWHAGQVLRRGRMFPPGHLKDFYAIAVHHAALCLWTYGIVTRASRVRGGSGTSSTQLLGYQGVMVLLDGEASPTSETWVNFGQGRPAIQSLSGSGDGSGGDAQHPLRVTECLLEDPRACMEVAQEILRANFVGVWESLPPLSENIILVLKQLENAAWAVVMD